MTRHGLARVLSKRGLCSRTQAAVWIAEGLVTVNGRTVRDAEHPVRMDVDRVDVRGLDDASAAPVFIALNKPRGLVTTARDEQGRDTVYRCFDGASLPWLAPVGRLDKASEGLLLFSNDPAWAARVTDPATGPSKLYHVQIDRLADDVLLDALRAGVHDGGETLSAASVDVLRHGERNAWLEIVLEAGRNRHIRRMLTAHGVGVIRLVRVAIGCVTLGSLPKGGWRPLSVGEAQSLAPPGRAR
ncbi:pseudouridine synthase [Cognatilysobacter lacus]|uniref:Pseudouridine synthase n=1 Tax=Cognatilysobacter lacus TaxID=1643323 RepID=A0A5D8Z870_9GAMM|nr:pseudouridine synthase [Lysobacter lacus]TZF90830.1 rRNA pseudouridine synthase [Lysobacter lacus]